jgi:hypothetical protein
MGKRIAMIALIILACILLAIVVFKSNKSENYKKLSIVTRVYPIPVDPTYNIEDIINKQTDYIFCKDSSINYQKFSNITINDLGNFLENKKEIIRLMVTPTGIVDWYDGTFIDVHVDKKEGKIWGRKKNSSEKPFELKQYQHDRDESSVNRYQKDTSKDYLVAPGEKYYLRTLYSNPENYRDLIPSHIPIDKKIISNTSFYISGKGIITNLHNDVNSGIIVQLRGRKRVYVFPKGTETLFGMYPRDHPLARRSRIDTELTEEIVNKNPQIKEVKGFECILEPGTWLYIPGKWLHYVETLDDETCSLIIRFTR